MRFQKTTGRYIPENARYLLGTSVCGLCRCFITPLTVPLPCMHCVIRFMEHTPVLPDPDIGHPLELAGTEEDGIIGAADVFCNRPDLPEHLVPAGTVVHGIIGVLPPSGTVLRS